MLANKAKLLGLIKVARGSLPADLLLTNGRVVNVFTGKVEVGNVAVYNGKIAGIGDYQHARRIIDLAGRYLVPGLINGHTHLESSMLDIGQYARAVVPHGTSAVVTDLHEIANVCGLAGIRYIMDRARRLPLDIFTMVPSCVPATHLETAGASIGPDDVRRMLRWRGVIGLGEVMNYPGVLGGDEGVLDKIQAARGRVIDGHAPGLSGRELNAYRAAGILSDHESVSLSEAQEKLQRGLWLMIREGSSEKNLADLLPLVTDNTYQRCLLVVDDRSCRDLLEDGDIDAVVRGAIQMGLDPVRAIQLATINPAQYFRLDNIGAIAPGYWANMIVIDYLSHFHIDQVFYRGQLVAAKGKSCFRQPRLGKQGLRNTVKVKTLAPEAIWLQSTDDTAPVIELVPGQIVTHKGEAWVKKVGGYILPDTERDILKLVVVERHRASGNLGLGLVTGFGLKLGGLASSVAHDSHNIIAVGTSDEDILIAVNEIIRLQGGLVVAARGRVLGSLPLPIAGMLSPEPLAAVVAGLANLQALARDLGTELEAPFATLSFLALPVIPELRLTDLGLVDVNQFRLL